MYYIPSAPILKASQKPSLLRVYGYGAFLCDRTLSLLSHSTSTSYLADIPPRLMVTTPSDSNKSISQLFVSVDRFEESLDTPECRLNLPTDGGGLLLPLPSWGNLCVKPGDDSLLVRMGLVPTMSQGSVIGTVSSDEDLESEVFRNTSFDATEWNEESLRIHDKGFQDIACGDPSLSEPHLDTQTWPSSSAFPVSKHLSLMPQIHLGDTSLFASSFFEGILASSSSNNFDKNIPASSDATMFRLSSQSPHAASSSHAVDDSQIVGEHLTDTGDSSYDISLEFSAVPLDGQFSFEFDFPQLPFLDDTAGFVAESFSLFPDATLLKTEETHPQSLSQNIRTSLNAEKHSGSSSHTSVITLASIASAQSFIMPTFASMESLIHISLDIPGLSSGPSFPSISSFCHLPPCASSDDLSRIQPPTWCEAEDDGDTFDPLPPDTASPSYLPSRLDFVKNFMDVEYTCPSLPSLTEEDS